ncbi:uncharacterized protein LOC112238604 [Oncorhynchus tshawytscha]|uniref:LRAT domain-containing protein n=1 Tax=Oncorhynchus tshawytscha TaxID=74940 RepID=A0A8C8IMA8_ONCTS|nr:uncharacterized protein LOC112238604 [Oncorhynchus tshawytscha]
MTMMRMKQILILAILLLQLITLVEGKGIPSKTQQGNTAEKFEFGDMIAFPRLPVYTHKGIKYSYTHYAIYVGDTQFPGTSKEDGQDIFHITGVPVQKLREFGLSNCIFGKLSDNKSGHKKDNYLDEEGFQKRDNAEIIKDITHLYKNCGKWHPEKNNCEHLATYLRYGEKHFRQAGTNAAKLLKLDREPYLYPLEKDGKGKRVFADWLIETRGNQGAPAA